MTIEEAIKWLDFKSGDIYDHVFYGGEAPEWEDYEYEALRMAIEALSKRDNAEPIPQWRGCMDGCLPYYDGKEVQDEQIH